MQVIDFLPEHYRERRKQCRVRWWWAMVACLFGGIVATTSSLQWLNQRRVVADLQKLELQVATARQLDQHLLQLETKVAALSHTANLYTFLSHPWPRTQILAAVVHPLPAEVELSSVRISESMIAAIPVSTPPGGDATASAPPPSHPAIADLQQLHDAHELQRVVVTIEGSAQKVSTLHEYLAALGEHPLVAEARLNSLETRKYETHSLVVFQLQLSIRAGHGQNHGPVEPLRPLADGQPATANLMQEWLR
jgi:hypothetical protein